MCHPLLDSSTKVFSTWQEFLTWKSSEEESSHTVELQATSDLFGVCVYVASLNQQNVYCWHRFKPYTTSVPGSRCSLRLPVYPFTANHIEIVQSSRNHYNSVVAMFAGTQKLQCPQIKIWVLNTIKIDQCSFIHGLLEIYAICLK